MNMHLDLQAQQQTQAPRLGSGFDGVASSGSTENDGQNYFFT
jgi:hypothetical protein